jgi:hypothetical protein
MAQSVISLVLTHSAKMEIEIELPVDVHEGLLQPMLSNIVL